MILTQLTRDRSATHARSHATAPAIHRNLLRILHLARAICTEFLFTRRRRDKSKTFRIFYSYLYKERLSVTNIFNFYG